MFKILFSFQKSISGIPSECQTTWVQVRPEVMYVGPDLDPNCLQNCSADDKSGTKVAYTAGTIMAQISLHPRVVWSFTFLVSAHVLTT